MAQALLDPSSEELDAFADVEAVLAWAGFTDDAVRKSFMQHFGLELTHHVRLLGSMSESDFDVTLQAWRLPHNEGSPTPVQRTMAGLALRAARIKVGLQKANVKDRAEEASELKLIKARLSEIDSKLSTVCTVMEQFGKLDRCMQGGDADQTVIPGVVSASSQETSKAMAQFPLEIDEKQGKSKKATGKEKSVSKTFSKEKSLKDTIQMGARKTNDRNSAASNASLSLPTLNSSGSISFQIADFSTNSAEAASSCIYGKQESEARLNLLHSAKHYDEDGKSTTSSSPPATPPVLSQAEFEDMGGPGAVHDRFTSVTGAGNTQSSLTPSEDKNIPDDDVQRVCIESTDRHVQKVMMNGADPNQQFAASTVNGMKLTFCTPLAIAVLRDQKRLVKWLVDLGANPDSSYGFIAGAEGRQWSGACIHAAVARSQMEIVKLLISCRADVHLTGSNQATLLWNAAYFNKVQMVEYFISQGIDVEQEAVSQDDALMRYTPLHVASKSGHREVVQTLLAAKAACDPPREEMCHRRTALQDAIEEGHSGVVNLLVSNGAMLTNKGESSCLDMAFRSGNSALISAIAEGLTRCPTTTLGNLTKTDLSCFLRCDGNIPSLILQAIFRPCELRFWVEQRDGSKKRTHKKVAFVHKYEELNVWLGPHPDRMNKMFNDKEPFVDGHGFLSMIAPEERKNPDMALLPVKFLACLVPNIHMHLDVVLALSTSRSEDFFMGAPCRAILAFAAERFRLSSKIFIVMAVIEVLNLVIVNVCLDKDMSQRFPQLTKQPLQWSSVLGLMISVIDTAVYLLAGLGYWRQKLFSRFLKHWFHGFILVVTCCVMVWTNEKGIEAKDSTLYSTCLGSVIFAKWIELLLKLCQFPLIGMRVGPIISTMLDIGPFCGVMAVAIMASCNGYYALGMYSWFDSFIIMYRLAVLGDFNAFELENAGGHGSGIDMLLQAGADNTDRSIVMSVAEQTQYYYVVRVMLLLIGFLMSITLMNLYIGVLTVNYEAHAKKALVYFSCWRVSIIIETQAMLLGWVTLKRQFKKCLRLGKEEAMPVFTMSLAQAHSLSGSHHLSRLSGGSSAGVTGLDMEGAPDAFMWICVAADAE